MVARDGLWWLALLALVPWALACSRPGRRAFAVEWLAAAVGISASCFWSTYVIWITLIAVALVPATYMAIAGVLLRRLARSWPLAIAVPCAWISLETLRAVVEPPFGFGWLRLGHHAASVPWLAGSARVWGTAGVGFALAAAAGGIADVWRARRAKTPLERPRLVAIAATAPLLATVVFALATSAPATVAGPRVLLVQPSFEQERKMARQTGDEMLHDALELTRRGLDEARRANEPVDVVAWGETMMPFSFAAPDVIEAWDRGVRPAPWGAFPIERRDLVRFHEAEDVIVRGILYGRAGGRAILPTGTVFVSGVEHYAVVDGLVRRQNAIVAWDANGVRTGLAGKVHLVPGAEHLAGLERVGWVRSTARQLAGYVPDLVDFDRAVVLTVRTRGDRTWRVGATVCFDNAFEGPYLTPLREGDVDFHLVASNEAWYRESWEYDHMIAFSRMVAIESGRSIVRATNAGISCILGPDGAEVARLEVGGRDRMVPGTLRAIVPVPRRDALAATEVGAGGGAASPSSESPGGGAGPVAGDRALPTAPGTGPETAPRPIYVATQPYWTALWILSGFVLAGFVRRRPVTEAR